MVIVIVGARTAAYVDEVTPDQLIDLANDTQGPLPHTDSVPPGSYASDVEQAWAVLCKDFVHTKHFATVEEAERFYTKTGHDLSIIQTAKIIDQLHRLRESGGSARRERGL